MHLARRTTSLGSTAVALLAAVSLAALSACSKGSTSVDRDLTREQGGPLGGEKLCGNGQIDEDDDEECDFTPEGDKLGRASCESLGFTAGGDLTCDRETCIYDTSLCRLPTPEPMGGSGG